jgi:Ca2+-transporting ATPase
MKRHIPKERLDLLKPDINSSLSDAEAEASRNRFGSNEIAEQPPVSWISLARDAASDPMIWFLLLTSMMFGFLGQYTDMTVLLVAILPLIGMDIYLHRRTQASIEGLSSVLASTAIAIRNGVDVELAADALVPGDLVRVSKGNPFPADGLILSGEGLQAEESSLTGEAYPVTKEPWIHTASPDEMNWGLAGTRLLTGSALVRIIFTGSDTLYGEVVQSALAGPQTKTPLQGAVARLVRKLLLAAVAICILLAGVRLWQGFGLIDAFLSAATLAVAAIPEEFPVVLTFFLGVGVYRLAIRRALVRRGVAVENIGRVSVICSDKTGTITQGRLVFHEARPVQSIKPEWLLKIAALASREESGDPLDHAILRVSRQSTKGWRNIRLFPFTEARRRETAFWQDASGEQIIAVKGAAETIVDMCALPPDERATWLGHIHDMSASGQKVIGCAWRQGEISANEVEPDKGFSFAGLIGISDPIRSGVREAIAAAQKAGIQIVMVTGDHPETAMAIAREAGIADIPVVISGDELQSAIGKMDDRKLRQLSVVARATPAQKALLVEAFRRSGKIVAVTGDGVNDVPALRAADIGIAMGIRGTRSAREVSAIVLLDDNFRTIISAIAEGRQLFHNLSRSFAFLLMIHIPLVMSAALIPFLGYPLLYLPIHIVWLELLIHPAAILAFQQGVGPKLRINPETPSPDFFSRSRWIMIMLTGSTITAAITFLFVRAVTTGLPVEHARAMALVALIVALASLVAILTRLQGKMPLPIVAITIASAFIFTAWSGLATWLHIAALDLDQWINAASLGLLAVSPSLLFNRFDKYRPARREMP